VAPVEFGPGRSRTWVIAVVGIHTLTFTHGRSNLAICRLVVAHLDRNIKIGGDQYWIVVGRLLLDITGRIGTKLRGGACAIRLDAFSAIEHTRARVVIHDLIVAVVIDDLIVGVADGELEAAPRAHRRCGLIGDGAVRGWRWFLC